MPLNPALPKPKLGLPERLWLRRWERAALWGFLALILAFGAVTEMRSAFLRRRMTDIDAFLRAAWAVRNGIDIYSVTETNGWHYNYPPLFAIAMTPLASPPLGSPEVGMLPFPVSVAIWYALSVGFLWIAVHWLAGALARASGAEDAAKRFSRQWWSWRIVPILLCLMSIGRTLGRGQSNMVVLLFFCGMIALLLEGRRFRAGLCLAGSICIKVFPGFLLILPAVRRDFRCLAGTATGLFGGLVLIPLLVFGPAQTLATYRQFDKVTLRPGLRVGTDTTRAHELTTATSTGSQSFMVVLHNYLHPNRETRPNDNSAKVRAAHWALGAVLTAVTLRAGVKRRRGDAVSDAMFPAALIAVMLPISPISHVHYFIFALPLVMTLLADAWQRHPPPEIGRGYAALFGGVIAADLLVSLPFTHGWLRDFGVPLYANLTLWLAGIVILRRRAAAEIKDDRREKERD